MNRGISKPIKGRRDSIVNFPFCIKGLRKLERLTVMVREVPYSRASYQDFKYKELIEKIINIFYNVYRKLGYGFQEKVYKDAMMIEFKKEGIPSISQSGIRVFYKGEVIDEHYADILVDNKVIVKIKATKGVVEENGAQLIDCLKATNFKAGILLNFGITPEVKLIY